MHLFYVTYWRKIKSDGQHYIADAADEFFLANSEPTKCVKPFFGTIVGGSYRRKPPTCDVASRI